MHIFLTVWSKPAPRFKSFLRTLTNNQIVSTEKCTVRFVCLFYSMERDGSKKPHRISKFTQNRKKKNVNKTNIRIRNGDRGNWLTLHNMLCICIWLLVMWFSVLGKWAPFLWLFVWLVGYACAKKMIVCVFSPANFSPVKMELFDQLNQTNNAENMGTDVNRIAFIAIGIYTF